MSFFQCLTLILMNLGLSAWASDGPQRTLKSTDKKTWVVVQNSKWWVSENCKKSCIALKPSDPKKISAPGDHPAAGFCAIQGGQYIVGKYSDGNEDGLCVFKDGSYILGWDYYQKNLPKKVKK